MNENNEIEQVIYYYDGHTSSMINLIYIFLTIVQMALVASLILFAIIKPLQNSPKSLYLLTCILTIIFFYFFKKISRQSKDSYKIYENRIEFFNQKEPPDFDVIFLSDIDQVRCEDDFGRSYSQDVRSKSFIYCYFKNGYKSRSKKIRKDRLPLFLSEDYDKEKSVITILQFFQKKKKQVYISTRHKEINKALNLKNWTDPGIHPSVRL